MPHLAKQRCEGLNDSVIRSQGVLCVVHEKQHWGLAHCQLAQLDDDGARNIAILYINGRELVLCTASLCCGWVEGHRSNTHKSGAC